MHVSLCGIIHASYFEILIMIDERENATMTNKNYLQTVHNLLFNIKLYRNSILPNACRSQLAVCILYVCDAKYHMHRQFKQRQNAHNNVP